MFTHICPIEVDELLCGPRETEDTPYRKINYIHSNKRASLTKIGERVRHAVYVEDWVDPVIKFVNVTTRTSSGDTYTPTAR